MRTTMQLLFSGCTLFRPILEAVIDNTVFATPQRSPTLLRNVLLTHVMAHEIGHLLLGPANACVPQVSLVLSSTPEGPTTHPKCVQQ